MSIEKIDWTKPVRTINGLPVRVLCTDVKNQDGVTILGLVEIMPGREVAIGWNQYGDTLFGALRLENGDVVNDESKCQACKGKGWHEVVEPVACSDCQATGLSKPAA